MTQRPSLGDLLRRYRVASGQSQEALAHLGQTLAALRAVAAGDTARAAERAGVVARIGPEARTLAWATAPGAPIPD